MATSAEILAATVAYKNLSYETSQATITIPLADWSTTPTEPITVANHRGVIFNYGQGGGAGGWSPRRALQANASGIWKVIEWDDPAIVSTNVEWDVRIWEPVDTAQADNLSITTVAGVLIGDNGATSPAQSAGTLTNSCTYDGATAAYIYTDDNAASFSAKILPAGNQISLAWDTTTYPASSFDASNHTYNGHPVIITVDPGGPNERIVRSTTVDTLAGALDTFRAVFDLDDTIYREEDFRIDFDGAGITARTAGAVVVPIDSYRQVDRTFAWNLGPTRPNQHKSARGTF